MGGLETRIRLTVKNPALRTAMPLDSNGNARGALEATPAAGVLKPRSAARRDVRRAHRRRSVRRSGRPI